MFQRRYFLPLVAALAGVFLPCMGHAATSTRSSTIQVSARVVASCTIATVASRMNGDVSVSCAEPASYATTFENGMMLSSDQDTQGVVQTREGMTAVVTY